MRERLLLVLRLDPLAPGGGVKDRLLLFFLVPWEDWAPTERAPRLYLSMTSKFKFKLIYNANYNIYTNIQNSLRGFGEA